MDDDGPLLLALVVDVGQVEPDRELEVQLDGRALVRAPQRVRQRDVDLGAVEGAVAGVQLPLHLRLVQGLGEGLQAKERRVQFPGLTKLK